MNMEGTRESRHLYFCAISNTLCDGTQSDMRTSRATLGRDALITFVTIHVCDVFDVTSSPASPGGVTGRTEKSRPGTRSHGAQRPSETQ